MTTTRAPELHPLLAEADTPSFQTEVNRAIHHLGTEVNVIVELLALLKGLKGIKPCEKWGPQYSGTEWVSYIRAGRYSDARTFILQNHA